MSLKVLVVTHFRRLSSLPAAVAAASDTAASIRVSHHTLNTSLSNQTNKSMLVQFISLLFFSLFHTLFSCLFFPRLNYIRAN